MTPALPATSQPLYGRRQIFLKRNVIYGKTACMALRLHNEIVSIERPNLAWFLLNSTAVWICSGDRCSKTNPAPTLFLSWWVAPPLLSCIITKEKGSKRQINGSFYCVEESKLRW